ncbi:hypothetical protein CP061683_0469A, partial [Chlamydia psittaci 06-1683]
MLVLIDLC